MTVVKCQQKDIFKIKSGIPGHGPQKVLCRFESPNCECVQLECGCSLPISWLPTKECEIVLREIPKSIPHKRSGPEWTKKTMKLVNNYLNLGDSK